jgi:hypothetical protein
MRSTPFSIAAAGHWRAAGMRSALFMRALWRAAENSNSAISAKAILNGDVALTSTRLPNGVVTAEIARRQRTWLWVIDQPAIA